MKGLWFRHYKGTQYKVIEEATHTETGETMVIYSDGTHTWARPKKMFLETLPDGCGRFEPVKLEDLETDPRPSSLNTV